jgi:carbonic anhydrase
MKLYIASAAIAILTKSANAAVGEYTYYEDGGKGPSNWATLPIDGNECGGTNGASGFGQSPVTVPSSTVGTCDTDMAAYKFNAGTCAWNQLDFTSSNNGVKVAPKADADCSFGSMSIPHTDKEMNALQFHIHTYSEHEIEGEGNDGFFPAELHVVHQAADQSMEFAVFGTMIDVGEEDHPDFEYFLQGWEAAHTATDAACVGKRKLAEDEAFTPVQELMTCPELGSTSFASPAFPDGGPNVYELPTNKEFGVFTYKGGLTTPGCNEMVNWNLLDAPMMISQSQMDRLNTVILCHINADGCHYATVADEEGSTSRPPQPLNGRTVLHRCRDGPAEVIVDVGEVSQESDAEAEAPAEEGDAEEADVEAASSTSGSTILTASASFAAIAGVAALI